MNNNNPYSVNKFGAIPKELVISRTREEKENLFTCELLGFSSVDSEGKPVRHETGRLLLLDNERKKLSSVEGLSPALFSCLSEYYSFNEDKGRFRFKFGEVIVTSSQVKSNREKIVTATTEFLLKDYARMTAYREADTRTKRDIIREREIDLEELSCKLVDICYLDKPSIEKEREETTAILKASEDLNKEREEKIAELLKQIEELKQEEAEEQINITKYKEELKELDQFEEYYKTHEDQGEEYKILDEFQIRMNATKKAEIKAILQEHINRREEQENALQGEESLIPEEIQRKAGFYIEHGFIEEVKGAGHYKILRGLNTVQFAYIVQRVRAKTGYTLSIDDMTAYIYNKQGKPCSKSSFNKPNSKGIEDSILKELQELLSE